MGTQFNIHPIFYRATGEERVKVTGEPESFTQTVVGSLPSCSVVKPRVLVGTAGKVTGIASLQVFPLAETVTAVIFWLLIFRPQQKRAREQKAMLSAVRRGDTVVTSGGIVGKVTKAVDGEDLEVEISQGVKVKLLRSSIADVRSKAEPVNDNKAT